MRKIVLYIAMSLDGYIADQHGNVDWLSGQETVPDADSGNVDSYSEFVRTVDTVVMGWNTYHQIVTELSPDTWVYRGLTSYVITHRKQSSTDDVRFTDRSPCELVRNLRQQEGADIWICGGAEIVRQLMQEDLIDRFHISVIPTILGDGIPLFGQSEQELQLRLIRTQSYNGITDLVYERR